MTAAEIIKEAARRGLTIEPHPDGQRMYVEPEAILNHDPNFREMLRTNKPVILAVLRERAALHTAKQIICGEFDGNRKHVQMLASQMLQSEHLPICQLALQRVASLREHGD